jgi:hypothetical protein
MIVGKKTRNNRCEFNVRNTWGADCEKSPDGKVFRNIVNDLIKHSHRPLGLAF